MKKFKSIIVVLCCVLALTSTEKITYETNTQLVAGVTSRTIDICNEKVPIIEVESIELPVVAYPLEEPIVEEIIYDQEPEYIQINSTAFCDDILADNTYPHYGVLAGKREWLGKSVELYDLEYNYIGYFTFHDVGYGRPTGYGDSELLDDRSLGDIETGEVIDIWLPSEYECEKYGRKDIYMVWTE